MTEAKVRHFVDERFIVFSESKNVYEVDLWNHSCTCKGFKRWNRCKHLVITADKIKTGEAKR